MGFNVKQAVGVAGGAAAGFAIGGPGGAFAGASMGASLMGGLAAAEGYEDMAKLAKERGEEQRGYNEFTAKQIMAGAQIEMFEEGRQAELLASRAVAVAAAGGYIDDIDHLLADIHGEGAYRASQVLRSAGMEAEGLRFEGEQAAKYGADKASYYKAEADATRIDTVTGLVNSFAVGSFGSFNYSPGYMQYAGTSAGR